MNTTRCTRSPGLFTALVCWERPGVSVRWLCVLETGVSTDLGCPTVARREVSGTMVEGKTVVLAVVGAVGLGAAAYSAATYFGKQVGSHAALSPPSLGTISLQHPFNRPRRRPVLSSKFRGTRSSARGTTRMPLSVIPGLLRGWIACTCQRGPF